MTGTQQRVSHQQVHEELDPHYFADYVLFSGTLRHYLAKSLEDLFKSDPNDVQRRFFIVGLYREEYAAYEDMGAVLEALFRYRKGEIAFPVEGILRYKEDKVVLANLFSRRRIGSADDLYSALDLQGCVPTNWRATHPNIDAERVLRRMCRFIVVDCKANQQRYGIDAYNRIKHGLAFVPNGNRYQARLPNSPAVVIANRQPKATDPYIMLGLPMHDSALEERAKLVEFIQSTNRALVAFYLIGRYAEFLREKREINPPAALFNLPPLLAVRDFMQQLSEKPESAESNLTSPAASPLPGGRQHRQ